MRFIPDDGPKNAKIVCIGEMDSIQEEQQNRHFVGLAGQEWSRWLTHAGLRRQDIYVTNVVCYRGHPSNKIAALSEEEIQRNIHLLHERIAQLDSPVILTPMGNTALQALTGKTGITKHRGSIYAYTDLRGREIKVIPTLHPASLLYQRGDTAAAYGASSGGERNWLRRCLLDWERVASDAKFRELRLPQRTRFINPTWTDLCDYAEDIRAHAEILVADIETPHSREFAPGRTLKSGEVKWKKVKGPRHLVIVGLAYTPDFGMAVPTTKEYWAERGVDVQAVLAKLAEIGALPCAKGNQSGANFDRPWLHWYGINLDNYLWDTRWLHHVRDPLDDHSLAYQASIFTREPYWKDDGRESDSEAEDTFDFSDYQTYNATDVTVTRELVDTHLAAMTPEQIAFYMRHHAKVYDPLHAIAIGGMRMDEKRRGRLAAKFLAEAVTIQEKLTAVAGFPLYGPKGSLSSKKMQTFLYTNLRLPVRRSRKTKAASADEVTVRRLMLTPQGKKVLGDDTQPDAPGPLLLRHRRLEALQRFTKAGISDPDGYARSQIGWTYTLRFTMGSSPRGTGNNNQNTDRELLSLYVPDPGHVFVEVDASQAEDRVVKVLAAACTDDPKRREELLWRARAMPWENDEHWRAADLIFQRPRETMTKNHERYVGKRCRHACLTPEHEVLTPTGWVMLRHYIGQPVAQWDATNSKITFATPSGIHIYDYDGPVHVWQAQAIWQIVTPNHKMVYQTNGRHREVDSAQLSKLKMAKLPTSGCWQGDIEVPLWLIRLVVAIQADAHITNHMRVEFHLKKERKITRLLALLDAGGVAYHKTGPHQDDSYRITFDVNDSRARWTRWLTHWSKEFYLNELLKLNGQCLDAFLDELKYWDGSLVQSKNHKREEYTTKVQHNARIIKTIAHLRNRQALVRPAKGSSGNTLWEVSLNRRRYARRPTLRTEHYSGKVHCLTVPTGFFLVRYNGEISVTGNSNYGMRGATLSDQLLKEGFVYDPHECDGFIEALLDRDTPEVRAWQAWVRALIMRERALTTSWGYRVDVKWETLDDNLYRKMYALEPQNSVTSIIKQWGLRPLHALIQTARLDARIANEKHDSLLISCAPDVAWPIMDFLRAKLERPRRYRGIELMIPTEWKLGSTAALEYEFKKFPAREEVYETVKRLEGR